MSTTPIPKPDPHLISYMTIRRSIGFIGLLLPLVLLAGGIYFRGPMGIQPSISAYYYTEMGDVLVGGLCAVALFLFCYKGHDGRDGFFANVAAFFALVTALIPTTIKVPPACHTAVAAHTDAASLVHYAAAGLFLSTLAGISLLLFTLTEAKRRKKMRSAKKKRNKVYKACGIIMLICVAMIPLFGFVPWLHHLAGGKATFVLETIALWAFGVSWIVKGEAIFGDRVK